MFRIHPQYRLKSGTQMRLFKLQVHPLHKLMKTNPNPNPTPQSGQGTSQALPIKLQFHAVTLRYCHLTIRSRILHSSYTLYMQTPHLVGLKLTHHAHLTQHDQLVTAWDCSSGYSWHSWHSMNKWKGAVDGRGPTTSLTDVFCWVLLVECWFHHVRCKPIQSCWGGNCKKACHHTWPWKIPKQGTIFYVWRARGPKIDEINHWLSMSLITMETKESEKLYM